MRKLFPLLLGLLSIPLLSAAENIESDTIFPQKLTAEQLQQYCAASAITTTGLQRRRYCEGFLSGVEESARVLGQGRDQQTAPSLCLPADVSAKQMRADFTRNSAGMKPASGQPAVSYALQVLEKSFPCR